MQKEYVGIAKRENNSKRNYLVVNKGQAKHVPVSPQKALEIFGELAQCVQGVYTNEKVLVIGFAETATAIGAAVAIALDSYYMQTTREQIEGVDYLYFSEAHSHATEQKLVKDDMDQVMCEIDRILFVEDEVTTGNTILDIIQVLEKTYKKPMKFSVAAILNGMNEASKAIYDQKGIAVHSILKTDNDSFVAIADTYKGDGIYKGIESVDVAPIIHEIHPLGAINPRRLTTGSAYEGACAYLWQQIEEAIDIKNDNTNLLVLGTEECMYPAIYIGQKLEANNHQVKCHATTRSPITVSSELDYPLHTRFQLKSLYDDARTTYIYELDKYDQVLIITDATSDQTEGVQSLVSAIYKCGNTKINVVRWC